MSQGKTLAISATIFVITICALGVACWALLSPHENRDVANSLAHATNQRIPETNGPQVTVVEKYGRRWVRNESTRDYGNGLPIWKKALPYATPWVDIDDASHRLLVVLPSDEDSLWAKVVIEQRLLGNAWTRSGLRRTEWREGGSEEEHYLDDVLDGPKKSWFPNGQLKHESSYVRGKLNGIFKLWYEDGRLREENVYENGAKVSGKFWDQEGKLFDK